jgi:hypothetical protein
MPASVVDATPGELARIPNTDNVPGYIFDAGADAPDRAEVDGRIVGWLASVPSARRLQRVHRQPLDPAASGQTTQVYLLELAPDGRIALTESQAPIESSTHGVVEVYSTGETLPPYHVEALRAARAVWSRHT